MRRGWAVLAVGAMVAASCGGSDDDAADEPAPADEPAVEPSDGPADEPSDGPADEPADEPSDGPADEPVDEPADDPDPDINDFRNLGPATGEPIVFGMVNTEGTPGLDFPEMRTDSELAVEYLNEHGGVGGRPLQIEHCTATGSPETSQACAQELIGKGVELVTLGLDPFPGYDTFTAAGVPVVGALPIFPADHTANALFLSGGNATTSAAMAALAAEHFGAKTAGIISADNVGSAGSEASLRASLDIAGIEYVSIKGGDNETDAGFQGLLREATKDDPDVLFSLYSDAGCVGMMRGRVSLGIDTPAITTPICGAAEVTDVVGDDAVGWFFVAVGAPEDTPGAATLDEIISGTYGSSAVGSLGLGALGINVIMTLGRIGNHLAADGEAVTGAALYERLATTRDIPIFQGNQIAQCGTSDAYPAVCDFVFPVGEFLAGGDLATVPGFEAKSVVDYLP